MFSDTRLIAATNQDLTLAIAANRFRSDLYYRLNVIHLHLPSLRERREDLKILINHFLDFYRSQFRKPNFDFSAEARLKLETYSFPGNIRELKNIVERAAALSLSDCIESDRIFFQNRPANEDENIHGSITPVRQRRRPARRTRMPLHSRSHKGATASASRSLSASASAR